MDGRDPSGSVLVIVHIFFFDHLDYGFLLLLHTLSCMLNMLNSIPLMTLTLRAAEAPVGSSLCFSSLAKMK